MRCVYGVVVCSSNRDVPIDVECEIWLDQNGDVASAHRLDNLEGCYLYSNYDRRNTFYLTHGDIGYDKSKIKENYSSSLH